MKDIKLLALRMKERGIKSVISNNGMVSIDCVLDSRPVKVKVYFEKANFQINIGSLATIDKIEGQDIVVQDIEAILDDFLNELRLGQINVYAHELLGLRKFSVVPSGSRQHVQYLSILEAIVIRVGQSHRVGRIELVN